MRAFSLLFLLLVLALPARAENPTPYSGTRSVDTGQAFAAFVDKLVAAVKSQRMGIVAQAYADCGAKSIGKSIPGNRVIMIFRPDFAVRMLAASAAAGIEAPLRLYVTEEANGSAKLTYRLPSYVFAAYEVPALEALAGELDVILERIVAAALE